MRGTGWWPFRTAPSAGRCWRCWWSICDRCRYALEAQEQAELDDICAACTIPADIEELVRQETGHTAEVIATCVAESFRETLTGLRE